MVKLRELGRFLALCKIPNKTFYFEGSRSYKETDYPRRLYYYDTPRGVGSKFTVGKDAVGDWIKIFSRYYPGDPAKFSVFCTVYVRKKDVNRAKNLIKML